MRALKWIVGGLLALVLVVFLVGYIYLAGMDFNSLKPEIARAVLEGTGRKLTMAGDIKLSISLSPALIVRDVSLANAPWGKRPQMISVHQAEVEVALWPLVTQSRLEVNRLILDKPDILLEIDKKGRSNLDMQPQKTAGKTAPKPKAKAEAGARAPAIKDAGGGKELSLSFREVLIKDGKLELDDRKGGKNINLSLEKLALKSEGPASEAKLELKGMIDGQKFEAEGEFQPAAVIFGRFDRPLRLKLAAEALGLKVKLKGKVKDLANFVNFEFDLRLASTGEAKWGGERLKEGFEFKAEVKDARPRVYRVSELELKAGKSRLKGKLTVDVSGDRPGIKANLKAATLDLTPFTAGGKGDKAKKDRKAKPVEKPETAAGRKAAKTAFKSERVFPRSKLDLAALRKADLDLKLKAERILTGKLDLEAFSLDMVLQNGKLELKPAKAKLAGGKLKLGLTLDASRPGPARAALDMDIAKLDLAKFFDGLKMERPLEGKLRSEVKVKGSGDSVAAIMAGLDGKLAAVVKDGRLHKKHLNLLGAELASGLTGAFGNLLKNKQYTDLECLVVGFAAQKGLAKTTAIAMQTSEMVMLGNGGINLKTEEIDLAFKPRPRKGVVGGVTLSLGELVKPFKLGGTLAHPGLVLDEKEVAKTLGKTILGVSTYGTAGLLLGLASVKGDVKELCKDASLAALEGKTYKPRYSEKTSTETDKAASGDQKKDSDTPARAIEKGVGGVLKGLLGED